MHMIPIGVGICLIALLILTLNTEKYMFGLILNLTLLPLLFYHYFYYARKNIKYSTLIARLSIRIIFQQVIINFPSIILLNMLIGLSVASFVIIYERNIFTAYFLVFSMFWTVSLLMYFMYTLIS